MNVGGVERIERELAGRVEARGSRALAMAGVAELLEQLLFARGIKTAVGGLRSPLRARSLETEDRRPRDASV